MSLRNHYLLAGHSAPLTFPAFDGLTRYELFPTDFSSTMPSADCPLALANLTARLLRVSVIFVSSHSRTHGPATATCPCQGILDAGFLIPATFSQSLGLSRGNPDYFPCVTVGST